MRHLVEQNTPEWMELRLGKFTASTASDMFMSETTKGFQNLITRIAYERVTGRSQETYSNGWMKHGHEFEPLAVWSYETETFNETEQAGFYELNEWAGASPDRKIVDIEAGCEFKCPSFQVYDEYLKTKSIPKDYYWQIHFQLLCTGWNYIDYMPYVSDNCKQILICVERDESVIKELTEKLNYCIELVKQKIEIIKR